MNKASRFRRKLAWPGHGSPATGVLASLGQAGFYLLLLAGALAVLGALALGSLVESAIEPADK